MAFSRLADALLERLVPRTVAAALPACGSLIGQSCTNGACTQYACAYHQNFCGGTRRVRYIRYYYPMANSCSRWTYQYCGC
jgi:hypothetical protein